MVAGLAIAMAVAAPSSGLPIADAISSVPRPVQIKAQQKIAKMEKRLPRLKLHWQRKGYQVNTHIEPAADCAAHSYGQVRDFFTAHPCTFMIRTYGEFRDTKGDAILVAFSWVEMPTTSEAARFRKMVDTGGTGNVTELSRDTWRYRNVKYAGLGYDSDIQGRGVWNIQVQPAARPVGNVLIRELRQDVLDAAMESIAQ